MDRDKTLRYIGRQKSRWKDRKCMYGWMMENVLMIGSMDGWMID